MKRAKGKEWECKIERRRTCIHEAGHVVLRWHLKMTPTRVEIYDAPNNQRQALGFTHGDGKRYEHPILMALYAGGYAAELRQRRQSKISRFLLYSEWIDMFNKNPEEHKGSDLEKLVQWIMPIGINVIQIADDIANDEKETLLKQMKAGLQSLFAETLENAYGVINKNWNKVLQVAGLLEKDKAIGKREVRRLFAEWDGDK